MYINASARSITPTGWGAAAYALGTGGRWPVTVAHETTDSCLTSVCLLPQQVCIVRQHPCMSLPPTLAADHEHSTTTSEAMPVAQENIG